MGNLARFADDAVRAQYLADNVGDPDAALSDLMDEVTDYLTANDVPGLPEDLCGPVTGTLSALMVGSLAARMSDDGEWQGDPLEFVVKSTIAGGAIEHATAHGDTLAERIMDGATVLESYDNIVDWVTDRLLESFDADPDLVAALDGWDDDAA